VWLLRIIVFILLTVFLVIVALDNDASVDVQLLGWEFLGVRLFLVVFASAGAGFIMGLILMGIREVQWRVNVSKTKKEKNLLENEVRNLRAAPLDGLDDEAPSSSSRI
jgi:uncharacterized integral membrane protein